jgi:mannose-1-phosphate guanylyltransferase
VDDPARYGRIDIDPSDRVTRFHEKDSRATRPSWISAGVYLFNHTVLERIAKLGVCSIERDVLETMPAGSIHAFRTDGRFLDIGTPESLALASQMFPSDGIHNPRTSIL